MERPNTELNWDEETLIYVDDLESQNKELNKSSKLEASLRKSAETRCMNKYKEELSELQSQNRELIKALLKKINDHYAKYGDSRHWEGIKMVKRIISNLKPNKK